MTGAGISVSAGIPDFRTPGTGLYSQLAQYNLPRPEAIFAMDYFVQKPEAFYAFAQNFDLTNFNPTPTHFFIKMLQQKELLLLNPTQNIDNLEEKAGIDMKQVVQAHGANRGAVCSVCRAPYDQERMQQAVRDQKIFYCEADSCKGKKSPVKPNIVFFGEQLP